MPKREELSQILSGKTQSYSLSVEGTPALLLSDVMLQEELIVGDKVKMFVLPDGKIFVSKTKSDSKSAYTVGRITLAHIYFDDEMTVQEL